MFLTSTGARFLIAEGEQLAIGDVVGLDQNGRLQKAVPGSHYLGALPPGTVFQGSHVLVPEPWFTAAETQRGTPDLEISTPKTEPVAALIVRCELPLSLDLETTLRALMPHPIDRIEPAPVISTKATND